MAAKSRTAERDGNPLELVVARGHKRYRPVGDTQVVRNVRDHPIDALLDRKAIERHHHQAAEQLLTDWERSTISASRASNLTPSVDGGRPTDATDAQLDAMRRFGDARNALSDFDRLIVTLVVLERKNLDELGAFMRSQGVRWPAKRYGGPRVCEALHALAEHYGLVTGRRP